MAHPSRNSLEVFKQETGLHDVPLRGEDGSGPDKCCLLWGPGKRWLSLQGTQCQEGDGDTIGRIIGQGG